MPSICQDYWLITWPSQYWALLKLKWRNHTVLHLFQVQTHPVGFNGIQTFLLLTISMQFINNANAPAFPVADRSEYLLLCQWSPLTDAVVLHTHIWAIQINRLSYILNATSHSPLYPLRSWDCTKQWWAFAPQVPAHMPASWNYHILLANLLLPVNKVVWSLWIFNQMGAFQKAKEQNGWWSPLSQLQFCFGYHIQVQRFPCICYAVSIARQYLLITLCMQFCKTIWEFNFFSFQFNRTIGALTLAYGWFRKGVFIDAQKPLHPRFTKFNQTACPVVLVNMYFIGLHISKNQVNMSKMNANVGCYTPGLVYVALPAGIIPTTLEVM